LKDIYSKNKRPWGRKSYIFPSDIQDSAKKSQTIIIPLIVILVLIASSSITT